MKTGTERLLKFKKLQRRLGLPYWQVVGLLEALWKVTEANAPAGDIGRLSDDEIAAAIEWSGEDHELINALVDARWLDRDSNHRLVVHDWHDHAPNWLKGNFAKHGKVFASVSIKSNTPPKSYSGEDDHEDEAVCDREHPVTNGDNSTKQPETADKKLLSKPKEPYSLCLARSETHPSKVGDPPSDPATSPSQYPVSSPNQVSIQTNSHSVIGDDGQKVSDSDKPTPQEFIDRWNAFVKGKPKLTPVRKLTAERQKKIKARLAMPDWFETFRLAIKMLPLGVTEGSTWQPTLDWLIRNESNAFRLAEGEFSWRNTDDPARQKRQANLRRIEAEERELRVVSERRNHKATVRDVHSAIESILDQQDGNGAGRVELS